MSLEKDIATPSMTAQILKKHDLSAKKSLGQNFIIDVNILDKMLATAGIDSQSSVIEVGPGIGALTEQLAQAAKEVLAFEVDQRFIDQVLPDTLADYSNVTIINQDILEVDLAAIIQEVFGEGASVKMVSNLPYYITTPILMHFLSEYPHVQSITAMMQKEVGRRIAAKPGSKEYGSLSVAIQYYAEAQIAFDVPRTVFNPAPNVDSIVIQLDLRSEPAVQVTDEDFFFGVVRAAFAQRRKTLRNNLIALFGKEDTTKEKVDLALETSAIDGKRRGETLDLEEFARLSNHLKAQGLVLPA